MAELDFFEIDLSSLKVSRIVVQSFCPQTSNHFYRSEGSLDHVSWITLEFSLVFFSLS